ncbi:SurA N-terminal domain-containing protein [Pseudonocardia lacus]|uniref:SurA N-terminal domain-containing protein n=1 Tax=Pseudonocardia lacus TaxID=2835865 RepID=UPI001BDC5A6B|nr:SurA N-terminal domain-containing protein [Pseudonocardia lacus]
MRRRVVRVVVAVVAAGAVATGCGGVGSPGSAVVIGDRVVPLETVQDRMQIALDKPDQMSRLAADGRGPADVARGLVTQEVLHELVTREAAARRITVTEQQVDSALADQGGTPSILENTFLDEAGLRERTRDQLLAAEMARDVVGGLSVTADLVAATSREEADRTAQTLLRGGPAAEALFDNPDTAARGQTFQAVTAPDAAATVLFSTPVGGVAAFRPDPGRATWIVLRVTDSRTDVQSPPEAVNALSQSDLVGVGYRLLQPVAEEIGVTVNPRYGVWDPISLQVVAEEDLSGEILLPSAPAAG